MIMCYVFNFAIRGIRFFLSNSVFGGGKKDQIKILGAKKWISGEFWGFHYEENHCPDLSEHCK